MSLSNRISFLGGLLLLLGQFMPAWAQTPAVKGMVHRPDGDLVVGATVKWLKGKVGTQTDVEGLFTLPNSEASQDKVVILAPGLQPDTLEPKSTTMHIILKAIATTDEVLVTDTRFAHSAEHMSAMNSMTLSRKDLTKAACCNLSESLETSPAADISYADGVTGMRQISMLGLNGVYVNQTNENLQSMNGLASAYGMTFTPGPWLQQINMTLGPGSVINGMEGLTGQINTELHKPQNTEQLFVNVYGNQMGRYEGNVHLAHRLNDKWAVGLLTHVNMMNTRQDMNGDGFMEIPLGQQLNVAARAHYVGNNGWMGLVTVRAMRDNRLSGQVDYIGTPGDPNAFYAFNQGVNRLDISAKSGYVFKSRPGMSMSVIANLAGHDQSGYFGRNPFDGKQRSGQLGLLFRNYLGNTDHTYTLGAGQQYAQVTEAYAQRNPSQQQRNFDWSRTEVVPYTFAEYTYTGIDNLTLVAGIRADIHNLFGSLITPRVHARYALTEQTTIRLAAGQGRRVANPIADNLAWFASSRNLFVQGIATSPILEAGWNYGGGIDHDFRVFGRKGNLRLDAYYTTFTQQLVTDLDANSGAILMSGLVGQSYSLSTQAELKYSLASGLDLDLAYRWTDVQVSYQSGRLLRPYVSRNRGFINLAWSSRNSRLKIDATWQFFGAKRIPTITDHMEHTGMHFPTLSESPAYSVVNAQVSYSLRKGPELYIGAENLGNFVQHDLIQAPNQPFGPYFDATYVWGPVVGRMVYAGFRWSLGSTEP